LTKNELLAVLFAYREAIKVASPGLHPEMADRSRRWSRATDGGLEKELERYLQEASRPDCGVRVFFKIGPDLLYGGCNRQFASDAGLPSAAEMVGLDDFNPRISWLPQAAKYRRDDREVMNRRAPKLGIIERQSSSAGVIWLETSKVPVTDSGESLGVFGTYEIIDAKTASSRRAGAERARARAHLSMK
jgi:hypothetical protein